MRVLGCACCGKGNCCKLSICFLYIPWFMSNGLTFPQRIGSTNASW